MACPAPSIISFPLLITLLPAFAMISSWPYSTPLMEGAKIRREQYSQVRLLELKLDYQEFLGDFWMGWRKGKHSSSLPSSLPLGPGPLVAPARSNILGKPRLHGECFFI